MGHLWLPGYEHADAVMYVAEKIVRRNTHVFIVFN